MPTKRIDRWATKPGQVLVCAKHRLPLTSKPGKVWVRKDGERKQVDGDIYSCPAGCSDAQNLVSWKRPLADKQAKANLAAYEKDPVGYLEKVTGRDKDGRPTHRTLTAIKLDLDKLQAEFDRAKLEIESAQRRAAMPDKKPVPVDKGKGKD